MGQINDAYQQMNKESKLKKPSGLPYRRIVAKFGTSLLTGGGTYLDQSVMADLVSQIARLHEKGVKVIVVSSGAIASGRHKLGLTKKAKGIPYNQVLASVGQISLMFTYEQLFAKYNINVAQALLTKTDLSSRAGYLNARNTLLTLMDLGVICIVNENDVVAIDEIDGASFGDNDNLSAMVANLVDADLLLLLTNTEGLFTADPHRDPSAHIIPQVDRVDARIKRIAAGTVGNLGTGGMSTKVEAARLATASGVTVVIANGREKDVIIRLAGGEAVGTRFPPAGRLESRQRWMLCDLGAKGRLTVDSGAATALKKQNRSLLAAGIREVGGKFKRGDMVDIYDIEGNKLGCGIVNYGSDDIDLIKGAHSEKITTLLGVDYGSEVVHRNNLAFLQEG